ncbi:MAG TPA: hypothetical protein VEF89_22495 [Solirubrobacteraceae bacterium]|nr:hypothetical protein [Solirubrobacteraceae bacterium]
MSNHLFAGGLGERSGSPGEQAKERRQRREHGSACPRKQPRFEAGRWRRRLLFPDRGSQEGADSATRANTNALDPHTTAQPLVAEYRACSNSAYFGSERPDWVLKSVA